MISLKLELALCHDKVAHGRDRHRRPAIPADRRAGYTSTPNALTELSPGCPLFFVAFFVVALEEHRELAGGGDLHAGHSAAPAHQQPARAPSAPFANLFAGFDNPGSTGRSTMAALDRSIVDGMRVCSPRLELTCNAQVCDLGIVCRSLFEVSARWGRVLMAQHVPANAVTMAAHSTKHALRVLTLAMRPLGSALHCVRDDS